MMKLVSILLFIFFNSISFAQLNDTLLYTARQCYNLKGEVKTMITSSGDTLRFDRQGELINREGNHLLGVEDKFDRPHKLFFPDGYTRYETNMKDEEAALAKNRYIFDHKGRIIKSRLENTYLVSLETIYLYETEETYHHYPYRVFIKYSEDGTGSYYIIDYFYEDKSFDEQGNCVWRHAQSIEIEYDGYAFDEQGLPYVKVKELKHYEETAQYTYY